VLSQRWDELSAGDTIVLVVVGSGLTWAALQIEVA
jgi:3-oxoacyl-[acyl-carrier-protein] synthase III